MRLEGDTSDVPASAAAAAAASNAGDAASDALRLLMLALLSCSQYEHSVFASFCLPMLLCSLQLQCPDLMVDHKETKAA